MTHQQRTITSLVLFALAGLLVALLEYPDRGFGFLENDGVQGQTEEEDALELVEFTQAVGLLREHYVFEDRLMPRKMLFATLAGIEESVDAFLVTPSPVLTDVLDDTDLPDSATVQYRGKVIKVPLDRVEDLYSMTWKIMEIFHQFLLPVPLVQDMEEGAIGGMVSVLDPHTIYMTQRQYNEMKVSTQGAFGGLGIVISVREGNLKVVSVMPDTPASVAGIQKGDHIVQIGEESTVNMIVSEAANRMRGEPGTPITIAIMRDSFQQPRELDLIRQEIKVKSVLAKALPANIAYVRVKGFQQNSAQEVQAFLDQAYRSALPSGIILDLRGNAGGVMSAAIDMVDLFVEKGRIVSTIEKNRENDRHEYATPGDRYESVPMVVLVNHGSASASEIVTGALKYLDRATVMGTRTFGKGSVQYINPLARGALKMTIAQYVGPAMEAIQGLGIEPHIELRRVLTSDRIELPPFSDSFSGEGSLPHHLKNAGAVIVQDAPCCDIRYVPDLQTSEDENDEGLYDEVLVDYPVELAQEILLNAGAPTASETLEGSTHVLEDAQEYQDVQLGELAALEGTPWNPGPIPESGVAKLSVEAHFTATPVVTGHSVILIITAANNGSVEIPAVYARTESTLGLVDLQSCLLGDLFPGETRSCVMEIEAPENSPARRDKVYVDLLTDLDCALASTSTFLTLSPRPEPRLAISYFVDDVEGNRDNLIQSGESLEVVLRIRNVGNGPMTKGLAIVKNLSGPSLFITHGREDVLDLAPGEERTVRLAMKAPKEPEEDWWHFDVGVVDLEGRRQLMSSQHLPVVDDRAPIRQMPGRLTLRPGLTEVRTAPHVDAPVEATIPGPGQVRVIGKWHQWYKIEVAADWPGWIRDEAVSAHGSAPESRVLEREIAIQPSLEIDRFVPAELSGTAKQWVLEGFVDFGATSDHEECGISVYRNGRKVDMTYLGEIPREDSRVPFQFVVPLEEGQNRVVFEVFQKDLSSGYTTLYYNRTEGETATP